MNKKNLPSISVLIPTLNAARVLELCLKSIARQDYPKEKIEIIVADGGSIDDTLSIVNKFQITNPKFHIKIYPNPLKTGEAGKAVALRYAGSEIVALIDSDNILPGKDWFLRMVEPFSDQEIIGTEPWEYVYRRKDSFITRYCALMGLNDPLVYFLGNYDRLNVLSEKWTEAPVIVEDKGDYLKVTLSSQRMPTIGANGFLIRREKLLKYSIRDYLFDIDILAELIKHGDNKIAKVKVGIIHLFSGNIAGFYRKQQRRVRDYLFYTKLGLRKYAWSSLMRMGLLKYVLYCFLIFPLFLQSLLGFIKKPDFAWFFHPLACWITLWVYGRGKIEGFFKLKIQERTKWGQ